MLDAFLYTNRGSGGGGWWLGIHNTKLYNLIMQKNERKQKFMHNLASIKKVLQQSSNIDVMYNMTKTCLKQ